MKTYCIEDLKPFFIGRGTERMCFRSPSDPRCIVKISPKKHAKQTLREIDYFRFLQKQNVPFHHIPEFKGEVRVKGYVGFEQAAVLDGNDSVSKPLLFYLNMCGNPGRREKDILKKLLTELYQYMYKYNITPCDLNLNNILLNVSKDSYKLVLVDGVGSPFLIPIGQYVKPIGRKRLERKWRQFVKRDILPIFAGSN